MAAREIGLSPILNKVAVNNSPISVSNVSIMLFIFDVGEITKMGEVENLLRI